MKHGSGLIESKLPERGRGMTNGEMIQKVFNCEVCEPIIEDDIIHVIFADKKDSAIGFDWSWWIAEYKEPTTKNEAKYCDRNICLKNEYNNVGCEDCEVTKSQESITKNDLGVTSELEKNSKKLEKNFGELDCISREQALKELKESAEHHVNDSREEVLLRRDRDIIRALPSVTPQEPQTFKWCDTCKEYDQEKHCCHRWSKVIRDTVDEMKQEQEPILDKIRAEIDNALSDGMVHKKTVLGIIDKYKAESEDT